MRMTGPFTSQIPLLIGIEVLTIVAFVLSILTLTAGFSTNSLRHSAILTFNTSSIKSALSNTTSTTTSIPDWYEVNYLCACSGMWNTSSASNLQSTRTCVHQKAGYTFSLAKTLPSNAAQLLPIDSSYGTLDTKAPLILLAIGIAFAGVSLLFYLYSIIVMLVKKTPPLNVLRIAFLTGIPAAILLLISSAKITAFADKMTGATEISAGVTIRAWMGWAFYVASWLATGFVWAAVGVSIGVAFMIAGALQAQQSHTQILP